MLRAAEEGDGKMKVIDIQVHESSTACYGIESRKDFATLVGVITTGTLAVVTFHMANGAKLWQQLITQKTKSGKVQQRHGLKKHETAGTCFVGQLPELAGAEACRFLEDDMLAGTQGTQGIIEVDAVDEGDIDRIHLFV